MYVDAKAHEAFRTEFESPKCEQYWPKPGTTMKYGDIKVESCSEDEYAEFTRRVFTVTMHLQHTLETRPKMKQKQWNEINST
ncbi:PTP27-like protein [Mya arenaria]|uniref:PTP27-like protein n=1 Tax=Mya arenaria TaxID=6604 RepID=A0ABY7F5Z2_MYAAR|nr:PTP27-like protein [Mya arenaria]